MNNLAERIAWAISWVKKSTGLSWVLLGTALGADKDTLAKYGNQLGGEIKGVVLENLVATYHLSPVWLLRGAGEPFPGARKKYPEVCGPIDDEVSAGARIAERCSALRLTQTDVAIKLGVSEDAVRIWEIGRLPEDEVLARLATFLKCSPEWIRTGVEPTSPSVGTVVAEPAADYGQGGVGIDAFAEAVVCLKTIFGSKKSGVVYAIMSNLRTFRDAVLQDKENQALRQDLAALQSEFSTLKTQFTELKDRLQKVEEEKKEEPAKNGHAA